MGQPCCGVADGDRGWEAQMCRSECLATKSPQETFVQVQESSNYALAAVVAASSSCNASACRPGARCPQLAPLKVWISVACGGDLIFAICSQHDAFDIAQHGHARSHAHAPQPRRRVGHIHAPRLLAHRRRQWPHRGAAPRRAARGSHARNQRAALRWRRKYLNLAPSYPAS